MGARKEGKIDDDKAPIGGALFANFGCIACHTQPDFDGKDEFDRVPLAHLKAKWQVPALLAYLKDPQQYYQWTRMPNFRLTDDEAGELAAYLLSGTQHEFAPGPKGDPAKGAQLVVAAGCMNCHAGVPPMTQPKLAETVKHGWTRGCMAADAKGRGAAPDFDLTGSEREALLAFAATGLQFVETGYAGGILAAAIGQRPLHGLPLEGRRGSVWSQLDNDMASPSRPRWAAARGGRPGSGQCATAPNFTWLGEKAENRMSNT